MRNVSLPVGLLIVGVVAVAFFSRPDKEPQIVTVLEQAPAPPHAKPLDQAADRQNSIAEMSSKDGGGPKMAFTLADDETQQLNTVWLAREYVPNMDLAEFHIRSTFVKVDPDELRRVLQDAYDARGGFIEPAASLTLSDVDIVFPLFPDVSVRAALVHLKVGRHSGLVAARFRTLRQESDQLGNTDNIYIEITSEGLVSGIVDTPDGMYQVRPTPTPGVLVVSEMDSKSVYRTINVD